MPEAQRCPTQNVAIIPKGTQSGLGKGAFPHLQQSIIPISNLPSIAEDVMTSTHKSANKSTVMAEG